MSSKYQLLALDLDGTTLSPDGTISPRVQLAVKRVLESGCHVSLCTGRSTATTLPIESQLGLSTPLPLVTFNGAVGVAADRVELFRETLTQNQVDAALSVAASLDLAVNYYDANRIKCITSNEAQAALAERYRKLTNCDYDFSITSFEGLPLPPKLILLTLDPASLMAVLKEKVPGVGLVQDSYFVECLPAGVTKGFGFEKLCAALKVPLKNTVAFGDGFNDVEFLQAAGLGVAMKNARDVLKEAADKVTEFTNAEDGLAIELEKMLEQGLFGTTQ